MPSTSPFQLKLFYDYVTMKSFLNVTYFFCVAWVKNWKLSCIEDNGDNYTTS